MNRGISAQHRVFGYHEAAYKWSWQYFSTAGKWAEYICQRSLLFVLLLEDNLLEGKGEDILELELLAILDTGEPAHKLDHGAFIGLALAVVGDEVFFGRIVVVETMFFMAAINWKFKDEERFDSDSPLTGLFPVALVDGLGQELVGGRVGQE